MKTIQSYVQAHALQLFVATLILTCLAFGIIDPASAVVGGIMLNTEPGAEFEIIKKALSEHGLSVKQFMDKYDTEKSEIKTRLLEVEQKLVRNPRGGGGDFGGGDDSIMPAFEASDGYKSLLKGETKSARIQIPAKALQRKMILSAITGGTIAAPDRGLEIIAPNQRRLSIRDLLPSVGTTAGSTEFVRELVYTNNAGPQGGTTSPDTATEGETKPASDMTFELINSPVITIAHTFTVSRQALDDSAALTQHLETRGIYGWQLEVDQELLTGTGANGKLNGLINNAAAFTGGATNQTPLDTVRKAITQLAVGNHVATGVVLNPVDAEGLELAKDSQQRYMGVVIYVNGQAVVWRIPIIETNAMTAGKFLAGDFTMAARIRDRQEAHVEISLDHSDYRTRNLALILIEGRLGLEIHRPTALCYGDLSNAG
ncbi:MAG: phage major capsid protein [Sterolibacterium sp.]|jgi:HK97 family phage major capsid protein